MSEVKRYDCGNGNKPFCNGCYQMEETPYGDYVSVEDFDKSQAEVEKLKQDCMTYLHEVEQLKAQRDELVEALREILACNWASSETATDFARSLDKGFQITAMKQIAQAALSRIEVNP